METTLVGLHRVKVEGLGFGLRLPGQPGRTRLKWKHQILLFWGSDETGASIFYWNPFLHYATSNQEVLCASGHFNLLAVVEDCNCLLNIFGFWTVSPNFRFRPRYTPRRQATHC